MPTPLTWAAFMGGLFVGVDAVAYRETLDTADAIYGRRGQVGTIDGDWRSDRMTAYAGFAGGRARVTVDGGMARLPWVTRDGFRFVVCHEIGHARGRGVGIASETEADRWALTKCALPFDRTTALREAATTWSRLGRAPWDWVDRRVNAAMRGR